jgi:hypothetical protein
VWAGAAIVHAAIAVVACAAPNQPLPASQDNVILVTLDGARTQEVFGGLDLEVFKSTLKAGARPEDEPIYRRFWAESREERRRKLMPFFWQLVTEQGSIAGDRELGSVVTLTNKLWFSYPGYSEILVGEAHDDRITSNDPIRNPFPTVLETVRTRLNLAPARVATFASWSVFNAIVEHSEGALLVNAGVEPLASADAEAKAVDRLQQEVPTPWDGTRFDAFTFRLAMSHLTAARPRLLYLAFDETDDWAHDGRYDRVLDAYSRTDDFLKELWTWIERDPAYRGRTHLLITTDHGRGRLPADWRNHGVRAPGSEDVWIALVSPAMSQRGPWRGGPALSTNQIAATLASWLGVDWNAEHPSAGKPIR